MKATAAAAKVVVFVVAAAAATATNRCRPAASPMPLQHRCGYNNNQNTDFTLLFVVVAAAVG